MSDKKGPGDRPDPIETVSNPEISNAPAQEGHPQGYRLIPAPDQAPDQG
ncbi:MAG: hypothetical protein V4722_12485 [Bacteroidota bacterium]